MFRYSYMSNVRFQRYALTRTICHKPGYRLYEAHDKTAQRRVFMKILDEQLTSDIEHRRRFLEAATLSSLIGSRQVVRILDCGQTCHGYAITSEPTDANPLSFYIQGIEYDRAFDIVTDIAGVLRQAHLRGVVHGTLHPGCIFIEETGEVKIDDFAIAWLIPYIKDDLSWKTTLLNYIAPEVREGSQVDGRADIYSLGILLFTLLVGELPAHAGVNGAMGHDAIANTLSNVRETVPISDAMEEFLITCMHPNPEHRFLNTQDFRRALAEIQQQTEPSERGSQFSTSARQRQEDSRQA